MLKPFFLIPLLSALFNFYLLLTILTVKKDKVVRDFIFMLIAFTVWPMASLFMRLSLYPGEVFWFQVSMTAILTVPLLIYCFVLHFAGKHGTFLMTFFIVGTVILAVMNLFQLFIANPSISVNATGQPEFSYSIRALSVLPVLFAGWELFCAAQIIRSTIREGVTNRRTFLPFFIGIGIMFAAMLLNLVPGLSSVFPVDPFACMINALLLYYMLYRKRLFTLTQLASSASNYLISTIITTLLMIVCYKSFGSLLDSRFSFFGSYSTLAVSVVFSMVMLLVFSLLKFFTNLLFVKAHTQRETLLKDFSLAINRTLNLNEIVEAFMDLLHENTDAETVFLFVRQADGSYAAVSCSDPMRETGAVLRSDSSLVKCISGRPSALTLSDLRRMPAGRALWDSEKTLLAKMQAELFLPILCDDGAVGFAVLSAKRNHRPYTFAETIFLESVASIVSIAAKNSLLYTTIQEEARLDMLTGLWNRRYFSEQFEQLFAKNRRTAVTLVLFSLDNFKLFNELYGQAEGDEMLIKFADILRETIGSRGILGRHYGKEFLACLPLCTADEAERYVGLVRKRLGEVCSSGSVQRNLGFCAGICSYPVSASNTKEMLTYVNMAVFAAKKGRKNRTVVYSSHHASENGKVDYEDMEAVGQEYTSTIYALTASIDAKDHYTFTHSENVSYLATQLAKAIGLDREHVEMIRQAGLLHDIGKISIPESILTKTTRLTSEEYEIMKSHVESSISIIRHLPSLDYVIPITSGHHERWDGKGYPRNLAGEEIPVGARCLAIADAFDAIASRRPYKESIPLDKAIDEVERCLGTQFDPIIGRKFVDLVRSGAISTDIYKKIS